MSQQEFAARTEISPSSLSGIFNGRTNPTMNHAQAIHKAFPNISIYWLLFGEGDMYRHPGTEADGIPFENDANAGSSDKSGFSFSEQGTSLFSNEEGELENPEGMPSMPLPDMAAATSDGITGGQRMVADDLFASGGVTVSPIGESAHPRRGGVDASRPQAAYGNHSAVHGSAGKGQPTSSRASYPAFGNDNRTYQGREGGFSAEIGGNVKIFDRQMKKIKEIRVFFDDGTYEAFVPSSQS